MASAVPTIAQEPESPPTAQEDAVDWAAIRARQKAERLERGEVLVARFEGRFTGSGLPTEPTEMIPLNHVDIRFLLDVSVSKVQEGELPEGWGTDLHFGIHSPTLFFLTNGIHLPEGHATPPGAFLFSVWRTPGGSVDLAVEPMP